MSTKEEVFDYVLESPENTNPAVLKSLLDGIETGSSTDIIDDTAASEEKTYSSSKVEGLAAKELPAVTSSDNGKVLGVQSGSWTKMEPAAGSCIFYINLTESSGTFTADKSFSEITAAIEAGKTVILKDNTNLEVPFAGKMVGSSSSNTYYTFVTFAITYSQPLDGYYLEYQIFGNNDVRQNYFDWMEED